jgi:preprotein translocase subunit SecD
MSFYAARFNLYLLLAAMILPLAGCETSKAKQEEKQLATLRLHLENHAQVPGGNGGETVSVLRFDPVLVTINTEPVLTEANIIKATLLETPGGFAIEIKFDETGTWILEQYTSANVGRHFAIFSQWSDKPKDSRWIAAPLISHRIANGVLAFTPDASREEAQKIVTGLNHMAAKIAKGQMK